MTAWKCFLQTVEVSATVFYAIVFAARRVVPFDAQPEALGAIDLANKPDCAEVSRDCESGSHSREAWLRRRSHSRWYVRGGDSVGVSVRSSGVRG